MLSLKSCLDCIYAISNCCGIPMRKTKTLQFNVEEKETHQVKRQYIGLLEDKSKLVDKSCQRENM